MNGFSPEFVGFISPFIEISSSGAPGERKDRAIRQEFNLRTDFEGYALKYNGSAGNAVSFSAGYKSGDSPTLALSARLRRFSVYLGDYNVRFGQGLTMWSGMSLSGVDAYGVERNPGGICPSSSFSRGTRLRGAALSYDRTRFSATVCASTDRYLAANAGFLWYTGQAGATVLYTPSGLFAGADFKQKAAAADLFGEFSISKSGRSAASLIGAQWQPEYLKKRYVLLRYYPDSFSNPLAGAVRTYSKCKDELGLSAAASSQRFSAVLDASCRPLKQTQSIKATFVYGPDFRIKSLAFQPQLRASLRYRPQDKYPMRFELRADLKTAPGPWSFEGRLHLSYCRETGILGYLQAGYEQGRIKLEVRSTAYSAKLWEDRIYVWQRDLPGSFNVPAAYGRGCGLSLWASYKKALYLRASYDICRRDDLTGKWEIKLQYVKHLFHSRTSGALDKNNRIGNGIFRKE